MNIAENRTSGGGYASNFNGVPSGGGADMSASSNCLAPTCTHFTASKASNLAPEIPDSPDSALCAELQNLVIALAKPQGSPNAAHSTELKRVIALDKPQGSPGAAEVEVWNAHQMAADKSKHLRNVQELKHGIALAKYKPQGSSGTAQLAPHIADDKSTHLRNAGLATINDARESERKRDMYSNTDVSA